MLDTFPALEPSTCAWTGQSRTFSLHLGSDVLARLGIESSLAFEKVPGRGLEIGGILLGRTESDENSTTFWVDGFLAVESEHRLGPSYLLSESDLARLKHGLGNCGRECVGIYRSQTRTRQLALDGADVSVFGQCFRGSDALFLMLAPALRKAALFSRSDGDLKCVREFALPAGGTAWRSTRITLPRDHAVSNRLPGRASAEAQPSRGLALRAPAAEIPAKWWSGKQRSWLAIAAAAILLAGAAAAGLIGFLARRAAPSGPAANVVELKIQTAGSALFLRWDPNSLPLRRAARVVLHVRDGDYQSDRELPFSEVRAGRTMYEPKSEEVLFRLEAYSAAPSASGSVRVISPPRRAAAGVAATPNLSRPAALPVPPKGAVQVQKAGDPAKGWLGMSLRPVGHDVALAFHLPQTYGFLVTRVEAGSPAGRSGVEPGDILLAVDAQRIADLQDLRIKSRQIPKRRSATLAIFRDGEIRQVEVNLGATPGAVPNVAAAVRP